MGKKNKNKEYLKLTHANDVIKAVTENRAKHGQIKVRGEKGKKKTKALKRMCVHHYYTKKNKLAIALNPDKNGNLRCSACGKIVSATAFNEADVMKNAEKMTNIMDRIAYLAIEAGHGDEAFVDKAIEIKANAVKVASAGIHMEEVLKRNARRKKGKKGKGGKNVTMDSVKSWIRR